MITAARVAGSLPLTFIVRRSERTDLVLALLYTAVLGATLAKLSLPYVGWDPSTETLFGIVSELTIG